MAYIGGGSGCSGCQTGLSVTPSPGSVPGSAAEWPLPVALLQRTSVSLPSSGEETVPTMQGLWYEFGKETGVIHVASAWPSQPLPRWTWSTATVLAQTL